jgi:hypothetical protein
LKRAFREIQDYLTGRQKMDTTVDRKKESRLPDDIGANNLREYRENIRRVMYDELRKVLDEEIQKAAQELQEEQRKAIRQILEEHKAAIRQVLDEEKKSIWEKAELLRQSILKFGL